MAYNKDNYEHNRLTPKQEKFCQEIAMGKSQRQAYLAAYPKSKDWQISTVDERASVLMNNSKVITRLKELGYKDEKKVRWTRQKALETINYVMDLNRKDLERIEQAYQTEVDLLNSQLLQLSAQMAQEQDPMQVFRIAKQMQEITADIAEKNKQKRVNATNIKGVFEGAKILNRMFGYDITKVEIKQDDEERDEIEKLTADELKAILNASKKGE